MDTPSEALIPMSQERLSEIIMCVEHKIDWLIRYASHSPRCLEEAEKLKTTVQDLERIYDEFYPQTDS